MITLTEEAKQKSHLCFQMQIAVKHFGFIEPGGYPDLNMECRSTLPRKATGSKFQDYMWQSVRTALIT